MTLLQTSPVRSRIAIAPDADPARVFAPIFARIAEGAAARDRDRSLPTTEIRALADAGFGALRVPRAEGGFGVSLTELFALLADLAAADSNIEQALRGHFAFIEDRLVSPDAASRALWIGRALRGDLVGNAWTEIGSSVRGELGTRLRVDASGTRLSGEKFYTTGSLYADWIDVLAHSEELDTQVIAAVSVHQAGVDITDDWDGFGQRTTASGGTVFTDAAVDPADVIDFSERFGYQLAFYQVFHLAALAGVARAAATEAGAQLAARSRTYSHGNADRAVEDAQLLQVVGEAAAQGFALDAITERAAKALEAAEAATLARNALRADSAATPEQRQAAETVFAEAIGAAELAAFSGQVAAIPGALRATSIIFDALGASAIRAGGALDRHWRNARTLASHNPWVYRARLLGRFVATGERDDASWAVGVAAS